MVRKANSLVRLSSLQPRFVVIGNPENRRIQLFQMALARLGLGPADVVSYVDLLAERVLLRNVIEPHAIVRLESPGENFEVEKQLLAAGADSARAERRGVIPCHPWFCGGFG